MGPLDVHGLGKRHSECSVRVSAARRDVWGLSRWAPVKQVPVVLYIYAASAAVAHLPIVSNTPPLRVSLLRFFGGFKTLAMPIDCVNRTVQSRLRATAAYAPRFYMPLTGCELKTLLSANRTPLKDISDILFEKLARNGGCIVERSKLFVRSLDQTRNFRTPSVR